MAGVVRISAFLSLSVTAADSPPKVAVIPLLKPAATQGHDVATRRGLRGWVQVADSQKNVRDLHNVQPACRQCEQPSAILDRGQEATMPTTSVLSIAKASGR